MINFKTFVVVGLSVMSACRMQPDVNGIATRVGNNCSELNLDDRFFRGVFSGANELELADTHGIPELLISLGEQSMSCDVKADEEYRLLYMPDRGGPLAIRAYHAKDRYGVTIASKFANDGAPKSVDLPLTSAAWEKITNAMTGYSFWDRLPYPSPAAINSGVIILHGPAWLLEGQRHGWYHAVSRTSAPMEAGFDTPARALFEAAGLEVPGSVMPRP